MRQSESAVCEREGKVDCSERKSCIAKFLYDDRDMGRERIGERAGRAVSLHSMVAGISDVCMTQHLFMNENDALY